MKGYYCAMDRKGNAPSAFLQAFAHEFCLEGSDYRAGDAVNYAIGQGDTIVTPLQLARAYAALSNGGTLYEPRIAKAIVSADGTVLKRFAPKATGKVDASPASLRYVDQALLGTAQGRHPGLEVHRLPARQGAHPRQDRLGRGLRQAVDLVGRDLRRQLRRGDDGQPGRHRLGHVRPGGPQDLGGALRHRRDGRRPAPAPRSPAPSRPRACPRS